MRLADIYIEPHFTIHKHCFPDKDPRRGDKKERFSAPAYLQKEEDQYLPYGGNLHQIISDFLSGKNPLNLAAKDARVMLLLGHPGQGKTSFCRRLVYDMVNGRQPIEKEFFLVRLRDVRKAKALTVDPLTELVKEIAYPHLKKMKSLKAVFRSLYLF